MGVGLQDEGDGGYWMEKQYGGGGSKNKCGPVKINVVWSWGNDVVICAD